MGVDRVREMRLMSLLMRPDRRAVNDRRALAKTRNRRRGGRFPQRAHRRAARTRGARADETPPRIRARADFFLTLSLPSPRSGRRRAARSSVAAARLARREPRRHTNHEHRHRVPPAPRAVGDPRCGAPHGDHPRLAPGQGEEGRGARGLFRGPAGDRLEVRANETRRCPPGTTPRAFPRRRAGGTSPGTRREPTSPPGPVHPVATSRTKSDPRTTKTHYRVSDSPRTVSAKKRSPENRESASQVRAPGQGAPEGHRLRGAVQEER